MDDIKTWLACDAVMVIAVGQKIDEIRVLFIEQMTLCICISCKLITKELYVAPALSLRYAFARSAHMNPHLISLSHSRYANDISVQISNRPNIERLSPLAANTISQTAKKTQKPPGSI